MRTHVFQRIFQILARLSEVDEVWKESRVDDIESGLRFDGVEVAVTLAVPTWSIQASMEACELKEVVRSRLALALQDCDWLDSSVVLAFNSP